MYRFTSIRSFSRFIRVASVIILFIQGCAPERVYRIKTDQGLLTVHLASRIKVNEQYLKVTGNNKKVWGFWNPETKEIWTCDYADTVIHEFKHFFEDQWHD